MAGKGERIKLLKNIKWNIGIAFLLLTLLISPACSKLDSKPADQGNHPEKEMRILTDYRGRQVEIPQNLESIICVNVGALRLTTYMQALDLVAGVEANELKATASKPFSYINKEAFAKLPLIGDNGLTYDEEIIKLQPQLIVAALEKEDAQALEEKLAIPVFAIAIIDSLGEDLYDNLHLLGQVYHKEARAQELTDYLKGLEEDLAGRTSKIPEEDKPTVYVGGISYKGAHGFDGTEGAYSPFNLIGARNLADQTGKKGPFNIDLEKILEWDPDIIFLDFNGMELINEYLFKNPSYFDSLSAVKNDLLYSQISFRSNAMNVELAYADAYYAGKIIFPQEFTDLDPALKADEIFQMLLGESYYEILKANKYEFKKMKLGD